MDKEKRKMAIMIAYASSVGIAMVLAIFGSLLLGAYIDNKLGTGHKFAVVFLLIGILAGFRNLYVVIKRYIIDEEDENKRNY